MALAYKKFKAHPTVRKVYVPIDDKFCDDRHIKFYRGLNCSEDIEKLVRMQPKKISNIVAAWRRYRKENGSSAAHTNDKSVVVWAPNKRMYYFLKHMTKWTVLQQVPQMPFTYFGINPDRQELQDLAAANESIGVLGGTVVGTDVRFLKTCVPAIKETSSLWDYGIRGPNKLVTSF
jgi:hypothetical protein